ncbi:helix-turn-helix domain-containing protein [Nocardia sp. NPDC050378]|uniref:IclR family transcriptional regulator n=1 Tax=Nocardia sp. NPDC050378 TaxID=3155400 RepID=UPI003400CDD7
MKPAQSAARALAVINYMTVHPRMAFTLSELATGLGVSPASMSAVLLALSESGYLARDARHRTYVLGPALVAAGHGASERHPVIEAARAELIRLAEFGSECVGSAAVGDDMMMLAIEGRPSGRSRESWIGQRIPLMPPFGQVFIAWANDSVVDEWLGRLSPESVVALRGELLRSLGEVRQRGVAIGLRNEPVEEVIELIHRTSSDAGSVTREELGRLIPRQAIDYALHEIGADERYDVANLAAPVFGPDGTVVFAMTLTGVNGIRGADLSDLCDEMRGGARAVAKSIGGRAPAMAGAWSSPAVGIGERASAKPQC